MSLDIERTKFNLQAFSILDKDNDKSVDFYEFVAGVYNLCTLEWESLVLFAFNLFDLDRSGNLDASEGERVRSGFGLERIEIFEAVHLEITCCNHPHPHPHTH